MGRSTVGVETGKTSHQAAAYDCETGRVPGQVCFADGQDRFERFRAFIVQVAPREAPVVVGVQATGHYQLTPVEFLVVGGSAVVVGNPYQAAQFRRSQGRRAKTDRTEAQALAQFVATGSPARGERSSSLCTPSLRSAAPTTPPTDPLTSAPPFTT